MSAENQPNSIGEILKGLVAKYQKPSSKQSPESLSLVRRKSLEVSQRLIARAEKYTKDNFLRKMLMPFVKRHINTMITVEIPEEELKQIMWECAEDIDELKKEMDVIKDLKSGPTDSKLNKKVMDLPRFKELADLL